MDVKFSYGLCDNHDVTVSAPLPTRRRLLAHERWFALLVLRRQQTHRTAAILRIEQNYGPEGIALWAASLSTAYPGLLIGWAGFLVLLSSGDRGWPATIGYWLGGLGIFLMALSSIRLFQAARAGRAFRGGRPCLRRAP